MVNVFYAPLFFICFRECIETVIVVSILLSFLKQSLDQNHEHNAPYKILRKQVWLGVGIGLLIVLIIGCGMIGAFYGLNKDAFSKTENVWEGVFALIASMIITIMGAALLRVNKMKEGWRVKIERLLDNRSSDKSHPLGQRFKIWSERYAMFLLSFITVLREGLEAVVFIGGVGIGEPATAFPIPVLTGLLGGLVIGFLIYKGGNQASLQIFLIVSTCFLYLVAAGLFSKSVGLFEMHKWNTLTGGDAAEAGTGPGSYDIRQNVWHVNCCSPEFHGGGGWSVFYALFGWTNSATYGTVISYNLYWIAIMIGFIALRYKETHGHWPLLKAKARKVIYDQESQSSGSNPETTDAGVITIEKGKETGVTEQVSKVEIVEVKD